MVTVLRLETYSIAHVLVGLLEITAKLVNSIFETPVVLCIYGFKPFYNNLLLNRVCMACLQTILM